PGGAVDAPVTRRRARLDGGGHRLRDWAPRGLARRCRGGRSGAGLFEQTAFRNSTLQGAYFILAARALGLDAGPMSGFDNAKVDQAFFEKSSWKSNFLCNIGYGDEAKLHPRGPRLSFEQTCIIV